MSSRTIEAAAATARLASRLGKDAAGGPGAFLAFTPPQFRRPPLLKSTISTRRSIRSELAASGETR
jgi:hypothetical protein